MGDGGNENLFIRVAVKAYFLFSIFIIKRKCYVAYVCLLGLLFLGSTGSV